MYSPSIDAKSRDVQATDHDAHFADVLDSDVFMLAEGHHPTKGYEVEVGVEIEMATFVRPLSLRRDNPR